ncbi:MAG: DUF262 domain-containing protein [Anaerolineales bacterium]|nr:DUF262 domain-containing protein [Anaerolineales bacterium]
MSKTKSEEDHIEPIPAEIEDDYSNDDLYNITSWGADLSFRELVQMYDEGDLLKPELQRKYVWDKPEASRFIDSILLGLPVPSVFLAKKTDSKMLIVDGYQRIMTVYDFVVKKIFRTDGKIFKLSNSKKINKRWRGKAFDELSETEQRKIRTTTIHAIIFVQIHPQNDTSMYQVFERINTSGRTLLPQEIRNCVYQGRCNNLLFELNRNKVWRTLYGLAEEDSRMRDLEFILRFLALSDSHWDINETGSISLKKYLNDFMGDEKQEDEDHIVELKKSFDEVLSFIQQHFGDDAFQNISKTDPKKLTGQFNPTIFDSLTLATRIFLKKGIKAPANLQQKRMTLLKDPSYQDLILVRTTNKDRIAKRIALALKVLYGLDYE